MDVYLFPQKGEKIERREVDQRGNFLTSYRNRNMYCQHNKVSELTGGRTLGQQDWAKRLIHFIGTIFFLQLVNILESKISFATTKKGGTGKQTIQTPLK